MKKKASKFVTELTRLIFPPYARIRYGFKFQKFKGIKPPCLVLCNHAATLDPIFVGYSFPFPINYVASDDLWRHKGLSRLLEFLIHPIRKSKSAADSRTVMDIISVIKQGGSVCIFPEGNRTMNGATVNIPDSVKKLVKKLRVTVALLNMKGGYFCDPRWSNTARRAAGRGRTRPTVELSRVITPEEQDLLDADALMDIIRESLYYNAFDDQRGNPHRYRGKKLAEHIERVLFICPECKAMEMYSKGNFFGCRSCGLRVEYTEYAEFKRIDGNAPLPPSVYEWDKWQIRYITDTDYSEVGDGGVITEDENIALFDITKNARRDIIGKKGRLTLYKKELVYRYKKKGGEQKLAINLDDMDTVAIQGKTKLEIRTSDGQAYLFKPKPYVSSYKYMVLIFRLKAFNSGKEFDFYGI